MLIQVQVPKLLKAPPAPGVRAQVEAMVRRASPLGAAAAVRGMALRPDSRDVLARFAGPALVLVGEHDVVTPRSKAEELAGLLQDAALAEIPGAGHLPNLENPQAFNDALGTFLEALG